MTKRTVNVTFEDEWPTVLFATCNICKCIIEYEFGMTKAEALVDLFKRHAHITE